MKIRELTLSEIRKIYKEYLYYDFPDDERKPLSRIEKSIRDGQYICIGAFSEGEEILAYAFFVFFQEKCLLDYYAVVPKMRGKGIGSDFLSSAVKSTSFGVTIIEIEDPDTGSPKEKKERRRRLSFYLKAGCVNTHVRVIGFGVDYLLLEYPLHGSHTEEEIAEGYKDTYRSILPKRMFERNIAVIGEK